MVSSLINNYPENFAVIQHHLSDGYEVPYNRARFIFYGGTGVPTFMYDGLFDAWPYSTYQSKLQQRLAIPTDVTMRVGAEHLGGNSYRIQIEACREEVAGDLDVRIHAVIVQDYYPSSPSYSRNSFRLDSGTSVVTLHPGACHYEERDVTVSASWTLSNLKIIAWVQRPTETGPADVYQAAKDVYPFDSLGPDLCAGDSNCDDGVDFGDINPFVQAMLCASEPDPEACWAAFYPDCPYLNNDANEDDVVSFGDINIFVDLLLGGSLPIPCP